MIKMLNICKSFFSFLNSSGIRYCHWKSNSHLDKAVIGETDLDILVHSDDRKLFELGCRKYDIKKILSPPQKQFPDIEDYLGFDYETGRLIHLHVHYSLILGQKYIKNHHLPIEDIFFQNLIFKDGIAIPAPELELILLIIRAHLKLDYISLIKHGVRDLQGKYYCPFPHDIEKEMFLLISSINLTKFKQILSDCKLPIQEFLFTDFIKKFSEKKYKSHNAFKIKKEILFSLKEFQRKKDFFLSFKYLYLCFNNSKLIRKIKKTKKKRMIGRGRIFSLVGADGSGKSTLLQELADWLSWKLSVQTYYYGIPTKNVINLLDFFIRACYRFKMSSIAMLIENLLWVIIARYRFKVFMASQEDVEQGAIILTDRFPLRQFHGMEMPMDGPRIRQCSNLLSSYLSHKEMNYYNKIKVPDRVFVLQVSIDELRRRKTDLDLETHKIKAMYVNALKANSYISLIDGNKRYNDVCLMLKRKIWNSL